MVSDPGHQRHHDLDDRVSRAGRRPPASSGPPRRPHLLVHVSPAQSDDIGLFGTISSTSTPNSPTRPDRAPSPPEGAGHRHGVRLRIGGFWRSSHHVPSRAEALVRVERSGGRVGGGRWYGPACPRVKGAARPWTGLRPALDPRDPPALGQGAVGRAMALPTSRARRLMSPTGVVADQRGEPTRRTGGRSPRWVCGSRGVCGAGR